MIITKGEVERICAEEILELWEKQSTAFPDFLTEIEEGQKQKNELFLEEMEKKWKKIGKSFSVSKKEQETWKQKIDEMLKEFLEQEQILGIKEHMSQELFADFEKATKEFVRQTRGFDSEISLEDIWQALRNYFIYAVIADLQGQEQECKRSALFYSLLYPYTDNYIDEKSHTPKEKKAYNAMIRNALCGIAVTIEDKNAENTIAENKVAQKTCDLIQGLLEEYTGEKRKELQNLLLWMLEAQSNSICQQSGKEELTEQEILGISVYKGSMSVLIDYFFTTAEMKQKEIEFYMKFGFLLQLADDLQDIEEDKKIGSQTIMVRAAVKGKLEEVLNRLFHYTKHIFAEFTPVNHQLKAFMKENCYSMLIGSALSKEAYLSKDYIKKLESFFPIHKDGLQRQPKMPEKSDGRMMQILDMLVSE